MNKRGGGGRSKARSFDFEWTYFLLNDPKDFLLQQRCNFNLPSNKMDLFLFFQWKIFFPIHWQIFNILRNGIPQSFMLSLKCDHPLLYEFPILFSPVKLKLGHKFSHSSKDSTFGFWSVGMGLCIFLRFSQFIKEIGKLELFKSLDYIFKFFSIH